MTDERFVILQSTAHLNIYAFFYCPSEKLQCSESFRKFTGMLKSSFSPVGMNIQCFSCRSQEKYCDDFTWKYIHDSFKAVFDKNLKFLKIHSLKFIHSVIWKNPIRPHDTIVFTISCCYYFQIKNYALEFTLVQAITLCKL